VEVQYGLKSHLIKKSIEKAWITCIHSQYVNPLEFRHHTSIPNTLEIRKEKAEKDTFTPFLAWKILLCPYKKGLSDLVKVNGKVRRDQHLRGFPLLCFDCLD